LRHLHVCGCQEEVRIYNPQEKKLDERIIIGYFIGYLEKLKGHMFYSLTHSTRIVKTENVRSIENDETSRSETSQNVEIKEVRVQVLVANTYSLRVVVPHVIETHNNQEEEQINYPKFNNELAVEQPQKVVLRRPNKGKKSVILNDYAVYLQELENELSIDNDLVSIWEAINDDNFDKWLDDMKDELKWMA